MVVPKPLFLTLLKTAVTQYIFQPYQQCHISQYTLQTNIYIVMIKCHNTRAQFIINQTHQILYQMFLLSSMIVYALIHYFRNLDCKQLIRKIHKSPYKIIHIRPDYLFLILILIPSRIQNHQASYPTHIPSNLITQVHYQS